MNVVLIIPTGIGCEIGGHAGDGNPVAKLMASVSDILITHPNVVNASDINEMTENTLYVEGSILDRFLRSEIRLQPINYNKILVAVNSPIKKETINAVSAGRATIGIDAKIIELETPLEMIATMTEKGASGEVHGWKELARQVDGYEYDALAITTPIKVEKEIAENYLRFGGINPWGGVEAKASRLIAQWINKPVAHAPSGDTLKDFNEIVDPRMSAEMISICYLHSVLKGLHKAPRLSWSRRALSVYDMDCLITPIDCVGPPHHACLKAGIPIIAVKENTNCLNDEMPESFIIAENYLEVAGIVSSMDAGIHWKSVLRPLEATEIDLNVDLQRRPV